MLEVFFRLPLAIGLSETFPVCFWILQIRLVLSLSGVWRVLQEAEHSQRVLRTSCTCGRKVRRRKRGKCKRVCAHARVCVCVCKCAWMSFSRDRVMANVEPLSVWEGLCTVYVAGANDDRSTISGINCLSSSIRPTGQELQCP